MSRAALLGILLPLFACVHSKANPALSRKGGDRGLFVGHTPSGELVVAAHHYDAMNGLAVTADEIDATATDDGSQLLCRREVLTGSHYPEWICRYKDDQERISEHDRQKARAFLEENRNNTCTDCANR